MKGWRTNEQKPKSGSERLVYNAAREEWSVARYEGGYWRSGGEYIEVTHWRPLPPRPKEEAAKEGGAQ